MIRDGVRKGQLDWRKAFYAVGFVVLVYAILVPAVVLYDKHPEYKPLFIAALAVDGVLFVAMFWVLIRWYLKLLAANRAASAAKTREPGDA